jgi:hypothetical protein
VAHSAPKEEQWSDEEKDRIALAVLHIIKGLHETRGVLPKPKRPGHTSAYCPPELRWDYRGEVA